MTTTTKAKATTATDAVAEPVDPVAAAEQEAREADELVAAIEERVREGDATITPEQLAAHRQVAEFAKLRADAARRTAEKERAAALLASCKSLRAEIETAGRGDATALTALLHQFEDSALAVIAGIRAHNARAIDWRTRMQGLGVPSDTADPAYDGLTAHPDSMNIVVGPVTVTQMKPEQHLGRVLAKIQDATGLELKPMRNAAHERADDILAAELGAPAPTAEVTE